MNRLQIKAEEIPEGIVAHVHGEAGIDHADELERKLNLLLESKPPLLVLDLGGLSFISSMGMGALVRIKQAAASTGGRVVLASLQPTISEAFHYAALDRIFDIRRDVVDVIGH